MSLSDREIRRLVEVAEMYYEGNLTQNDIARRLGVSRPLVSKLLAQAREQGIVNIQIKSPLVNNYFLLDELTGRFGIQGGAVVPEGGNDALTEKQVLTGAVSFLRSPLAGARSVGIGWGGTVDGFIGRLEEHKPGGCHGQACPLIGTAGFPMRGYHPNELVRVFSEQTGFTPNYLMAPSFPSSEQEMELFRNTENYAGVSALWAALEVAVVAIGTHPAVPDQATALRFGARLTERRAVGSILSYFFDLAGTFVEGENDLAIRIPLDQLRRVPQVVAIASSETSLAALAGALRSGLITHLITDEHLARELLRS